MSGELNSLIDLNDSDIEKIGEVLAIINSRRQHYVILEAFRREVIERFEDIGFKVDVKAWETNLDGVTAFDIEIQDRLSGEFDPDKMVWEATTDYLGLGEGGVIKSKGQGLILPNKHKH